MVEPAARYPSPRAREGQYDQADAEEARRRDKETMIGKIIFYLTVATAIWFFYWLNGIQCPC